MGSGPTHHGEWKKSAIASTGCFSGIRDHGGAIITSTELFFKNYV
ncbi:hypothetical protein VB712_11715 [Spirulina sp. CCNP1310]|nr:hypothetical protein [Spirulina sp. CCNP1310]